MGSLWLITGVSGLEILSLLGTIIDFVISRRKTVPAFNLISSPLVISTPAIAPPNGDVPVIAPEPVVAKITGAATPANIEPLIALSTVLEPDLPPLTLFSSSARIFFSLA